MKILLFFLSICLPLVLGQNITFTPSPPLIRTTVTGSCSEDASIADALVWSRMQDDSFVPLMSMSNVFEITNSTSGGSVTSVFTATFQYELAGTYRCQSYRSGFPVRNATSPLVSGINFEDRRTDIEINEGTASLDVSCYFHSAPTSLDFSVQWCFQPYVFPGVDTSRCTPLLNNSGNSSFSPTSDRAPDTLYSFTYRLAGVRMGDAGSYRCNVSNGYSSAVRGVRVRVRNDLEILWPAVGIMIQLVIITICILGHFLWDTYKQRQSEKARKEKESQTILATSPLDNAAFDHTPKEVLIKVSPN